jgi:hypothetical protein
MVVYESCAPWKDKITECRAWDDCPLIDGDQYINCLGDAHCPAGTICVENVFVPDLWYCDLEASE